MTINCFQTYLSGEIECERNREEKKLVGRKIGGRSKQRGVEIVGNDDPNDEVYARCRSASVESSPSWNDFIGHALEQKWRCKFSSKLDVPLSSRGESGVDEEGYESMEEKERKREGGWRSRWLKTLTRLTGFIARRRAGSCARRVKKGECRVALILIKIWPGSSQRRIKRARAYRFSKCSRPRERVVCDTSWEFENSETREPEASPFGDWTTGYSTIS